jgi:hypothetical protein
MAIFSMAKLNPNSRLLQRGMPQRADIPQLRIELRTA